MAKRSKRSKFAFNFDEMIDLAAKIEAAGGDLQKAADSALKAAHGYITPQLNRGISRHVQTGDTKKSLERKARVTWVHPMLARVEIGFDLKDGGLPSIFLMWGTPKMKPDTSLRKAAFGAKVRREVAQIQREVLETVLKRLGG